MTVGKAVSNNRSSDKVSENDGFGAGLLELLRWFQVDDTAADRYATGRLADARALDASLRAFSYLPSSLAKHPGPLSGISVGIKDIIATADMPTTNGSPVYEGRIPVTDAWIVERLRNLGATIFGKTVSTEFAWRQPGPTVNPWNPNHTPGGSSSGSAAAVAAGLVPLALGTQTLGSIVRPAAFNGVVGFKPSFGAIPRTGVHPLSPSLDHVGFFARCVDDVAFALSMLSGSSDQDPHGRPVPNFHVDPADGLPPFIKPRLAIVRFSKWSRAEPAQQKLFDAAIESLRASGARVDEVELAEIDEANWSAINTVLAAEGSVIFAELVEREPDRTSARLKDLVRTGKAYSAYDYLSAKALQKKLSAGLAKQMSGFDAILTLPAFGEAPEGLNDTGDAEYCAPWTFFGVPALSLPIGFGAKGLPLGIQIVGAYHEDYRMLCVAKWIESVLNVDLGFPDRKNLSKVQA